MIIPREVLYPVLLFIAFLIVLNILARLVKGLFKVFMTLSLLLVIVLGAVFVAVYKDARAITQGGSVVMALDQDKKLCVAFIIKAGEGNGQEPGDLQVLNATSISGLKHFIDSHEGFRAFIVHKSMFEKPNISSVKAVIAGKELSVSEIASIACSSELANSLQQQGLTFLSQQMDDTTVKALMFASAYSKAIEEHGNPGLFLAEHIKQGDIDVYPKSMLFKVLKFMPRALFNKVAAKFSSEGVKNK
ncbi:hypothetical protein J7L02_01505 [Candidatus Woesearchaeota archaeon]|nr:hypothetical protein [Candidatus Woesearchaeota archaeon]